MLLKAVRLDEEYAEQNMIMTCMLCNTIEVDNMMYRAIDDMINNITT